MDGCMSMSMLWAYAHVAGVASPRRRASACMSMSMLASPQRRGVVLACMSMSMLASLQRRGVVTLCYVTLCYVKPTA